jgi:hypothetical protein
MGNPSSSRRDETGLHSNLVRMGNGRVLALPREVPKQPAVSPKNPSQMAGGKGRALAWSLGRCG